MSDQLHELEEGVKDLAHEADEGASARTPLILVGGITVVVAVVIAVLLVIAFAAYYLLG